MNVINYHHNYIPHHSSTQKATRKSFCATLLDDKNIKSYKEINAEKNIKKQFNKEKARAKVIEVRACIVGLCASAVYFLFR